MNPSERVRECMDRDGVPVRYAYSLPDQETLYRLIDFPNRDVPPYLFSVLLDFEGEKEIAFGDARRHHEIVEAIELEKGRYVSKNGVGGGNWKQIQIDLEKTQARFSKIGVAGSLHDDEVMLLLARITPSLFSGRIEVRNFTTLVHYVYDPTNGELQRVVKGVQGDEIRSMGRVQVSPVLA